MQAAYRYAAEGGAVPLELETAWRVQDIGAEAVLGINAPAKLVRRVTLSGAVYRAFISRRDYRDKDGAQNWTEWAGYNKEANRLLVMAERYANE